MNRPKLIVGLVLVFVLGGLAGAWGDQPYVAHSIKPKAERLAKNESPPCIFKYRMARFGKIINELDFIADQKKRVDDILTENQDERKKLMDGLKNTRKQLKAVVSAKEFNEADFRKAFQRASSIKEEMAVLRAKIIPELRAVLSPEQIGYLRGRMETKNEFCKKDFRCPMWKGRHRSLANPEIHHQKHQEQGDQSNS